MPRNWQRPFRKGDNLVVFPCGGLTSAGIQLVNTCPVDNWLMLFQALVKLRKVDLDELGESGQIIYDALKMIDEINARMLKYQCYLISHKLSLTLSAFMEVRMNCSLSICNLS